jgi:hypothetical protein
MSDKRNAICSFKLFVQLQKVIRAYCICGVLNVIGRCAILFIEPENIIVGNP